MKTALVTIELALPVRVGEIPRAIEGALREWGEPLRWAITAIDPVTRLGQVEAVVTIGD